MLPHYKLTILRNRRRVRDLRIFRDLVETYFDQAEYDENGMLADWERTQDLRSRINRLRPRIVQIIEAAGIGDSELSAHDQSVMGDVESVRNMFDARYGDRTCQEVLDVVDMALGVYENTYFGSLGRTVNPLHYAAALLTFVARLPRRALAAVGIWPEKARPRAISKDQLAHLEAAVQRITKLAVEMEKGFEEIQHRQARYFDEANNQLVDLAERLDFAERVLAQQRPLNRLEAPDSQDVVTPV